MANPRPSRSQLADDDGDPMIGQAQALVADSAVTATTQPNVDEDGITAGGFITRAARVAHVTMTEALLVDVALNSTKVNAILDILEAHGLMKDA